MTAPEIASPTHHPVPDTVATATRPRIVSRALLSFFVACFGTATSFYLLLPAVPMYATSGGSDIEAGLATGALMLSTVVAELAAPSLMNRFGSRSLYAAGLLLLGAPSLALAASPSMALVISVCLVRGVGFAIVVVVGGALLASLVPRERRSEGLGLHGVVVGVPSVLAVPLGIWLAGHVGYPPVFVAGAGAVLAGLAALPHLPGRPHTAQRPSSLLAGLRSPVLMRPSVAFGGTALAAGIVVTFLPLGLTSTTGNLAAVALFVQAAAATFGRWWAGRHGDRHGPAALLVPGVLIAATGMFALVATNSPLAILIGMLLFGAGFGFTQNASLSLMYERVSMAGHGMVSALWNLAYDGGLGLGAAGFGVLAAHTGYSTAFMLTGALLLTTLIPLWHDRAAQKVLKPTVPTARRPDGPDGDCSSPEKPASQAQWISAR